MQPGPADEFHVVPVQVEIAGQYGLDVTSVRLAVHWLAELDDAAEFTATLVIGIRQDELRVVLGGHGIKVPARIGDDCEPNHKSSDCGELFGNR